MKKVLFLILLSLTFINVKAYTNNNDINITEEEYSNLLSVGFTDNEIDNMDIDTYNEYKNTKGIGLSKNEIYLKTTVVTKNGIENSFTEEVSEEEYLNGKDNVEIKGTGTVYTEYKKLITSLSQTSDDTVTGKVTLEWRKIPKKRSYDIIGIGYQTNGIRRSFSPSFQMNYSNSSGNHTSYTFAWNETPYYGDSAVYQLPSGSLNSLSSYILVRLKRRYENTPVTEIRVYGDYAHATSTISLNNALLHDTYYTGIALQNSIINYYDTTPECGTVWYGSI